MPVLVYGSPAATLSGSRLSSQSLWISCWKPAEASVSLPVGISGAGLIAPTSSQQHCVQQQCGSALISHMLNEVTCRATFLLLPGHTAFSSQPVLSCNANAQPRLMHYSHPAPHQTQVGWLCVCTWWIQHIPAASFDLCVPNQSVEGL